jgi:DNA-binding transcriptional LysR family regulator
MIHTGRSLLSQIGLVRAGLGVSLIPAVAARLPMADVVYASIEPPARRLDFAMVYPIGHTNPALDRFLDTVRNTLC